VVFDDDGNGEKMWVIGGIDAGNNALNDVWNSVDGKTWTQVKPNDANGFSGREKHASVVFDESMWVIGGLTNDSKSKNDVWSSTNGKTWNELTSSAAFSVRQNHQAVVFDDGDGEKMYVIGGNENGGDELDDVWRSDDGITWTEVTKDSSAKFPARTEHTVVNFDRKLWVIGGYKGSEDFNDVWSSADGKTWTEVTKDSSAKFPARYGHAAVNLNNKLWVIAGVRGISELADVWSSDDGITWTQVEVTNSAEFKDLKLFSPAVFNNRVWLLGGSRNSGATNEIWSIVKD
jgi:hypothetical protein